MDIRTRIIVACRELSYLQGFYGFNMDELASRAGVSKRTIYRYYRSKEDIIEAALDTFMNEVAGEVARLIKVENKPEQIIASIFKYLFMHGQFVVNPRGLDDLRKHYPHLWQKIDKFRVERAKTVIALITAQSDNKLVQAIDQHIITAVIIASIQAVLNPDFILENGLTFEEAASQLSILLMRVMGGIQPD